MRPCFFGDTISEDSLVTPQRYRVRIFVDFWNFTLLMRDIEQDFSTDWKKLGPVLTRVATETVSDEAIGEYQGLNFYVSYDPASENDKKMYQWVTTVVSTFPGVNVSIVPRQKRRSLPRCPVCYNAIAKCPSCNADMRGTEEKGIDVRMATAMISLAWEDNYDIAVLISSDRDFVPVAEFLETKGIKVVHGAFPRKSAQLTQKCWASINLADIREEFRY